MNTKLSFSRLFDPAAQKDAPKKRRSIIFAGCAPVSHNPTGQKAANGETGKMDLGAVAKIE